MKKLLIKLTLLNFALVLFAGQSFGYTFDWKGTSTTWAASGSWTKSGSGGTSTYPGEKNTGDIVRFGVTTNFTTRQPTLSATLAHTIASIEFGDNNGNDITLTISSGATLTVAGSVTQDHNAGNGGINVTVSGTGTAAFVCNSLNVGNNTAPPGPNGDSLFGGNLPTNNVTAFNCNIPTFTINGDITLNSTSSSLATWTFIFIPVAQNYSVNNPQLNLNSGILTVNNIITTNSAYVSRNDGYFSVANSATYKMDIGTSANMLNLLGASPLTVATGGVIDFVSGGTVSASTVNYGATSGTQTVYTAADTYISSSPTVYPNLTLTATSAKTVHGGTMSIGYDWVTTGGAINLNTNGPTVTVANGWTNSTTVTQGSGNISIGGDLLNSAGTLTLGNGSLTVTGDYTNNGTYTQSTGNTVFNGPSSTLKDGGSGTVFNSVIFNGSGTAILNSGNFSVSATGVLTMANTNTLNANGHLTLISTSGSSATVAAIPSTCSITGNVAVQRYITGGSLLYRGYRLMSSPVNTGSGNYSINYLKNSIYLTGTTGVAGGFDLTAGKNNPTLYLFRENMTPAYSTFLNSNFRGINNINSAPNYTLDIDGSGYTIPQGNGFLCFFRGDRTTASPFVTTTIPVASTTTATGTLNQGSIAVKEWYLASNLGYTAASPSAVRGFNLVGNPYASSIDWDKFSTGITGTSISSTMYILNPKSKNYRLYTAGTGGVATDGTTNANIIPSGEGFFVVATAVTPTPKITFTEAAKTNTQPTNLNLLMGKPVDYANNQYLRLELAKDSINTDNMLLRFNNSADAAYSPAVDAPYKPGFGEVSLYSVTSDHIPTAIKARALPKTSETIPLTVTATTDGIYYLNMKSLVGLPQLFDIWLKDAYQKDSLDMRHNATYAFNVLKNDTNTFGSKRFTLVIRQNQAYAYRLLAFNATKVTPSAIDRQVEIVWKTENEQNYTNFTVERSIDSEKTFNVIGSLAASDLGTYSLLDKTPVKGTNIYRLKQEDINGTISYSAPVRIEYTALGSNLAKNSLNVYPNPASATIHLTIDAGVKAAPTSYNILITNSSGLLIKNATSAQPQWQSNVSSLLPGTYVIKVFNNTDKTLVGDSKFIKL